MNINEITNYLLNYLLNEKIEYSKISIPKNIEDKKSLIRGLMNIREPESISEEFLNIQNEYLKYLNKDSFDNKALNYKKNKIALWQGDITKLKVDAIVNAANNRLLGCFHPNHNCIDNSIHSMAGVQLRLECHKLMQEQNHLEETGKAKITSAYNLPSEYIIHTVGPIIYGEVNNKQIEELRSCYLSSLSIADEYKLSSIAFCCISTGEYSFPNEKAAQIAIRAVNEYIKFKNRNIKKVIFNVFKDKDYEIYKKLLG